MTHHVTHQCLGCRVCARLNEHDPERIGLLHQLTANMLDLQQICLAGDEIEYDVLSEINESAVEDVINEYLGMQMPGTSTHQ